jgi:simple sugar transport system substrate-binding protein
MPESCGEAEGGKSMNKAPFTVLVSLMVLVLLVFAVASYGAQSEEKLTPYYVDHCAAWHAWTIPSYRGISHATAILAPLGLEGMHMSAEVNVTKHIDILRRAVAANPDGQVTTMIDSKSFEPILRLLADRGMPIMAAIIEDPRPVGQRIPYLTYYGEKTIRSRASLTSVVIEYIKETGGKKPQLAIHCSPTPRHFAWEARLPKFDERLSMDYGTDGEIIVTGDDP